MQIIALDKILNEPKTLARILVNNQSTLYNEMVGIENRGASLLSNPKKSYGFKTIYQKNIDSQKPTSFFNIAANTKWILDAMYIDQARLRNKTSFQIWNSLNANSSNNHHAIEGKFVEVFLNNKSMGLYHFTDNFTSEKLHANFNSVLYVGKDNQKDTYFIECPKGNANSAFWGNWEQKIPEPKEKIDWHNFEALLNFVVNSSDVEFKNNIAQYIDTDNFVDYYLFVCLFSGYDNLGKNWMFYKQNPQGKFIIIPWDLDATWGRDHAATLVWHSNTISNHFFDRLITLNANNFKDKLKDKWNTLRGNEFAYSTLIAIFNQNFETLNNSQIIPIENQIWSLSINLQSEQQYINGWISQRLYFLDNYFLNL